VLRCVQLCSAVDRISYPWLGPMGLLLRLRIERAKTLLEQNGSKISEVAATLGFADQSHFTRKFRCVVGITPAKYRNQSKLR
jgi:AraC-like DNA-binding protein